MWAKVGWRTEKGRGGGGGRQGWGRETKLSMQCLQTRQKDNKTKKIQQQKIQFNGNTISKPPKKLSFLFFQICFVYKYTLQSTHPLGLALTWPGVGTLPAHGWPHARVLGGRVAAEALLAGHARPEDGAVGGEGLGAAELLLPGGRRAEGGLLAGEASGVGGVGAGGRGAEGLGRVAGAVGSKPGPRQETVTKVVTVSNSGIKQPRAS